MLYRTAADICSRNCSKNPYACLLNPHSTVPGEAAAPILARSSHCPESHSSIEAGFNLGSLGLGHSAVPLSENSVLVPHIASYGSSAVRETIITLFWLFFSFLLTALYPMGESNLI